MNKFLVTLFLCILNANLGYTQRNSLKNNFFKVNDTLYISNEISVQEYFSFLEAKNFNEEYMFDATVFRDTVVFPNLILPIGFSEKYYAKNGDYSNYPIVGISYNQAMAYCTWLKESLKDNGNISIKTIRFPSVDEYLSLLLHDTIKAIYSPNNDTLQLFERDNEFDQNAYTNINSITLSCDILQHENISGLQDGYLYLGIVNNNNGLSNLIGNVSEYTYSENSLLIWGNNFSGKIIYLNSLSSPHIMLYDPKLMVSAGNTFKSAKVGFRVVLILNK